MKSLRLYVMAFVLAGLTAAGANAQSAEQGFAYLENGQQANARAYFAKLAADNPTADNQYYLGAFYMTIGQRDSAKAQFEKGLAADAKSALNTVGMGEVALASGNGNEAEKLFKQAAKLSRNRNAEVFFRIAEAYRRAKDPDEAENFYQKAIDVEDNPWYYVTLGDMYIEGNEHSKAIKNYELAKYYGKTYAKAYLRAGKLFEMAKDYNQALGQYNEGAAANPEYAPTYKALGEVYFLARQYDKAAENYAKYAQMTGNNPDDVFVVAGYHFLNSQYPETIKTLEPLGDNYSNPVIHRLRGRSYYEMKDYANGVQQMDAFFQEAPADVVIDSDHLFYGRLLISSGKDTLKGVQELHVYADKDSTMTDDIYRETASILFSGRKFLDAAREYDLMKQKGLTLGANDYFTWGRAYYYGQDFAKADSAFAYVTDAASQSPTGWLWRAYTNAKLEADVQEGKAKPFYEKFIETAASETEKYKKDLIFANQYLMIYYYKVEDWENARKYASEILVLDPENAGAKEMTDALAKR